MDVISRSSGAEQLALLRSIAAAAHANSREPPLRVQPGPAVLGGPDQVSAKREIGVCHGKLPARSRPSLHPTARERRRDHLSRAAVPNSPGGTYVSRRCLSRAPATPDSSLP